MEDNITKGFDDFVNPNSKELPPLLNTITILTIIGSVLTYALSIYSYLTICKSAEKASNQEIPEVGSFLEKMIESAFDLMIKECDNRLVVLVATLATTTLCLIGALLMRKLRKQGFMVYLMGEIIGPASMYTILGASLLGSPMFILGLLIPIVFVIMYATQRKYLTQ